MGRPRGGGRRESVRIIRSFVRSCHGGGHSVHCAYDTESIRSGSIRYRRYHGPQYFFTHLKLTSNGIGNYFRCCQLVCFNLVLLSIYSGPVMPDQSVHR